MHLIPAPARTITCERKTLLQHPNFEVKRKGVLGELGGEFLRVYGHAMPPEWGQTTIDFHDHDRVGVAEDEYYVYNEDGAQMFDEYGPVMRSPDQYVTIKAWCEFPMRADRVHIIGRGTVQLSQPVNAHQSSVVLKSEEEHLELTHAGWEAESGLMAFRPID